MPTSIYDEKLGYICNVNSNKEDDGIEVIGDNPRRLLQAHLPKVHSFYIYHLLLSLPMALLVFVKNMLFLIGSLTCFVNDRPFVSFLLLLCHGFCFLTLLFVIWLNHRD